MKEVQIYTDGACSGNPGAGGYGAVILYENKRKELSQAYKITTNNRMELMAVIKSLETLEENCQITLYSDSKYVVDAIEKGWVDKWQKNNWMRNKKDKALNIDLWKRLLQLLKIHKIKFIWVKGHSTNIENGRCDKLATTAITDGVFIDDNEYLTI